MTDTYIVACLAEVGATMVLATRRVFATREAAEEYARTIHHARYPHVIEGDFSGLRLPMARTDQPQE